jgi:WD40 repeat protein
MVHIFNTSLGKELTNFYAHEDSIVKLFFSAQNNYIITDGADSTCKVWDLSNSNKIPSVVYYDTESTIISADYRHKDTLHICIDEDGHFVMRNIKQEKEHKKIKLPKENYKFVKFNPMNESQYFIGSEESFKVYDLRTNLEINNVEEFKNSIDFFNDSKKSLVVREEGLEVYTFSLHETLKEKEWLDFGAVTHFNINSINYSNPDIMILGNESGDVYLSNLENIEN